MAAAVVVTTTACDLDRLLDVPDPAVATPGSIQTEASLPVLLAGAQGDFQVAFSGSGSSEGQVNMAGLFTDELHYTSTFPTRIEVDQRSISITNSTMEPIHRNLHRARSSAERAVAAYDEFSPEHIGRSSALNLHGYTFILFAENYCSGVPFSTMTDAGETEYGDQLTTTQMLEAALASFDAALAGATGTGASAVQQRNLASVGRARTLLNLDRHADAAAAVADVPTGFVFEVEHSSNSTRQQNATYVYQYQGRRWSVADQKGANGLPFRSAGDPRVPFARGTGTLANGFDNSPLFLQQKYTEFGAAVVLASGVEARLIEAEAALRAGTGEWLTILNELRASPPASYFPASRYPGIDGLAPLTDPGSDTAREDLLFRERAFWLYLTSHRLGDLRRQIRQYGRTASQVFPTGEYGVWHPDKGGEYGPDVNLPVPFDEQNNPNFQACLDRNA
jgi:starch-binding outer membrane protein, SusD/RagB family